jgi:alkylation response protein AidB-like acyl-CoA dehydrogenase
MSATLEDLDLAAAFADVVDDYAGRAGDVLFDRHVGQGPDGDLDAIPQLVDEARTVGLVADSTGGAPGTDYGIWGDHVLEQGCDLDLRTLATLGRTCAGLAAALHAEGIGRLALGDAVTRSTLIGGGDTVAAVFVPDYGVALDPRAETDAVHLHGTGDGFCLRGSSGFVWSSGEPDWLTVVARTPPGDHPAEWVITGVRAAAPGVGLATNGHRIGLRAIGHHRVDFDDTPVADEAVIARGDDALASVTRLVACDWLGCAAIALGAARRAHAQATAYAGARRQGGRTIAEHAAVRLLLAQASHHITTLETVLGRHATVPLDSLPHDDLLRWAITARLGVGEHAAAAVTDSLQVHGGYGYMDDYGLSKRLRDVHALGARHGSREQLLLLLHPLDATDPMVTRGGR